MADYRYRDLENDPSIRRKMEREERRKEREGALSGYASQLRRMTENGWNYNYGHLSKFNVDPMKDLYRDLRILRSKVKEKEQGIERQREILPAGGGALHKQKRELRRLQRQEARAQSAYDERIRANAKILFGKYGKSKLDLQ